MSFYSSQPSKAFDLVDKQLADGWTPEDITRYFQSLGETENLVSRVRHHILSKMVSKNPWCRVFGCQNFVPSGGGYPGLPQSHCYRCGLVNSNADIGRCLSMEFQEEPIYQADIFDKLMWKIAGFIERRRKRAKA